MRNMLPRIIPVCLVFVIVPLFGPLAQEPPRKTEVITTSIAKTQEPTKVQTQTMPTGGDSLMVGAVTLRLGMPKDVSLDALRSRYDVEKWDSPSVPDASALPEDWRVQGKGHKTPIDKVLGTVRFRSGKLVLVSREWTPEDKEYTSANVAEIIYTLATKFVGEENVNCHLRTWTSQQEPGPGHLEFRETHITCGRRQIVITLSWQSSASWVQITESIGEASEISPFDAAQAHR